MTARYAMGAVIGHWKLNVGPAHSLEYFEKFMLDEVEDLHSRDLVELCKAFRENRMHHRDHMRHMIINHWKQPVILDKWHEEITYNQRTLHDLFVELDNLKIYDKDLWMKAFETLNQKKKLKNLHFFAFFHQMMVKLNTEPTSPMHGELDEVIAKYKERHYVINREWRYNFGAA